MRKSIVGMLFSLGLANGGFSLDSEIYDLGGPVESRSISFENPTGEKGGGGRTASELGKGRKGAPAWTMKPGDVIVLCDIDGPAVIRHIWLTLENNVELLQGIIVRVYWDYQEYPSIEVPLGPFFGVMHGEVTAYQSAVHSVNSKAGLNNWMKMPFRKHAKMVIVNESPKTTSLYYNIDYTIGDDFPRELGYLHAIFRRENPTALRADFEILPKRQGRGRYLGCLLGIRTHSPNWWGEGEFKVYLDGDQEYPTICGTGTEDFVGQSWGLQDAAFLYAGTSLYPGNALEKGELNTLYRWHIRDPIFWKKDIRVTIQQIGCGDDNRICERQDDWSVCSFWYEPVPSRPVSKIPEYDARIKDYLPEGEHP